MEWFETDPLEQLKRNKVSMLSSGTEVYDLSMFNPDIAPARLLMDKLMEATAKPYNHRYAVSRGVRKLREAFAHKYQVRFGVAVSPETEICVTMGAKDALLQYLRIVANRGDVVALLTPTYPAFVSTLRVHGMNPHFISSAVNTPEFWEELESAFQESKVKVLITNFPNNPSGQLVDKVFWCKVLSLCVRYQIFIFNDFVYGEMGFHVQPCSLLAALHEVPEAKQLACEAYSLSKAYSVPGWRVGALVGAENIVQKVARIKSHIDYGIFLPVQLAAAAGLTTTTDLVSGTRKEYEERTKILVKGLQRLNFEVNTPQAGGVVWAKLPPTVIELCTHTFEQSKKSNSVERHATHWDLSRLIAHWFLEYAAVLISPGAMFGENFAQYVRFAAVQPIEKIRSVLARIEHAVENKEQQVGNAAM